MLEKRHLKLKLPLLLGAIPFLLAGVDAWLQGKPFFGTLHLLMAGANLVALRFVDKMPRTAAVLLQLCNALLALVVAYDFLLAGKKGLPYVWVVVGVMYLGAGLVAYRKSRSVTANADVGSGGA